MCQDCGCQETNDQEHQHSHDHSHDHHSDDLINGAVALANTESNTSPESFWVNEDFVTLIASGDSNGNQYALFDVFIPTDAGTIPHIHTEETETFIILEGEVSFQAGDEVVTATAGDVVAVPPGTTHAYQNSGTATARMLVVDSPAIGFEDLVRETSRPGTEPNLPPLPVILESIPQIIDAFLRNSAIPLDSLIFSNPQYSVNEDGTPIAGVTVVRPLSNEGEVNATITLSDGSAESPEDYTSIEIPVNFADGQSVQFVNIPIVDDDIIEGNETINLTISEATGSVIGLLENTATLTIVDNDALPDEGVPVFGTENDDILSGSESSDNIQGGLGDDLLSGEGSRDLFTINRGDGVETIVDFTGVGTGRNPSADVIAEIDTLKFEGEGLTANNLILTQEGEDLRITFAGVEDTAVVLQDFDLEDLDNLRVFTGASVDFGNILFAGETAFQDSFDVFDSNSQRGKIFNENTVTFLNDLDNNTRGFDNSNDVINGQAGDDKLEGLSGDDILRGGAGMDTLIGGFGRDLMLGGSDSDVFVLEPRGGIDRILDFTDLEDLIGLTGGLTFEDLTLIQGTGSNANDTLIQVVETNELLAIVEGVETTALTEVDFTLV